MMLHHSNQNIILLVTVLIVAALSLLLHVIVLPVSAFVVVDRSTIQTVTERKGRCTPSPLVKRSTKAASVLTVLYEGKNPMQRPLLDQIATTLFNLETKRVESSSVIDAQGRYGEPMEWSNGTSWANQFSVLIASNPIGYIFKQTVANLVAGEYNEDEMTAKINQYIQQDTVVMFSFTTCPFCRKAKDILDERNIKYTAIELDTLEEKNEGNVLRAQLGKMTKRTSMPNIFIHGQCIGGCNDGYPGLMPLIDNDQLDALLLA